MFLIFMTSENTKYKTVNCEFFLAVLREPQNPLSDKNVIRYFNFLMSMKRA